MEIWKSIIIIILKFYIRKTYTEKCQCHLSWNYFWKDILTLLSGFFLPEVIPAQMAGTFFACMVKVLKKIVKIVKIYLAQNLLNPFLPKNIIKHIEQLFNY
jgi:hypothetical protein